MSCPFPLPRCARSFEAENASFGTGFTCPISRFCLIDEINVSYLDRGRMAEFTISRIIGTVETSFYQIFALLDKITDFPTVAYIVTLQH